MSLKQPISLITIIQLNLWKVLLTWLMVLVENVMLILLPLFIGFAIDGVLEQDLQPLWMLALCLFALVIVSVVRRFYDTRVYGAIRVKLANLVERNLRGLELSAKDARLTMSRELVDFLEEDLPSLMTAVVQLIATVVILATFDQTLALSMLGAGIDNKTFIQISGWAATNCQAQINNGHGMAADMSDTFNCEGLVLACRCIVLCKPHVKRERQLI